MATQTDTLGMTLAFTYDAGDRLLKTTYPDGTFEEISYAACCGTDQAKPAWTKDRAGRTTEYVYDAMGQLTKIIDPSGNDVEYLYGAGGQLQQLKDTKNNATNFTYDANGQVTKKTYADGTYEQMTYGATGQLLGYRDAKNNVVNYEYDVAGRPTKLDYPNLTDVTMSYDALGRLSTKSDAVGTSTYAYDTLGRITSIDGPWDNDTISYAYDSKGRQSQLSINGAAQANYAYDSFDRLTQVSKGTQNFGYSYNGASDQLTQLTMPGGSKTSYSYDAMQRLTEVQSLKADATTNLAKFDYGYNTRDVRTFVEKTIGGATTQKVNYSYDNIDQLTKELSTEVVPSLDKEYSYDAMGNRISSAIGAASTAYTSNNLNQITQTSLGVNNTAITYDANGNTVAIGAKTFGYNDADQLTSVVVPNTKKSEFVYDSDGRKRISKEFAWQNGAWVQSDETRFVYDGLDLVQERSADGTVKASYVRDGNIGGVLSRTTPEGTFYYHYDGGGNVVALTDANENIVASYSYDAFGNTLSASGPQAEANPFRFSSKYYDGDTGLYDYGLRHYDSSLGRWINRDPIAEEGGLNLYGMVANDPVSNIDEYGLAPWGHHYIPQAIWRNAPQHLHDVFNRDINRIDHPDYNKQNGPAHNGKRYGGHSARDYDQAVRGRLNRFLRTNKIKCLNDMTRAQAQVFANTIRRVDSGVIGAYNRAVGYEMARAIKIAAARRAGIAFAERAGKVVKVGGKIAGAATGIGLVIDIATDAKPAGNGSAIWGPGAR